MNFTSASSPTMNGKMPHIQCTADDIGEIVLLPGDPARVSMFEDLLEVTGSSAITGNTWLGQDITMALKLQCVPQGSAHRQQRSL